MTELDVGACVRAAFRPNAWRRAVQWLGGLWVGVALAGQSAEPETGVKAGDGLPSALTLADARKLAYLRNWDLLAARAEVDQAQAQRWIAREFPNPVFSWSTTKVPVDGTPAGTVRGNGLWSRSYDTILAVNQLFEIGGKRSARKAGAEAGLAGAQARLDDARRVLDLGVAQAYVGALLERERVRVLTESADLLRREAGIAAARLAAGDLSSADEAQIQIAADRLGLDARAAAIAESSATTALEVLLGFPEPGGRLELKDSLMSLAGVAFGGSSATGPRPDAVAAEADLRKTEADVKLQRAMRVPDPSVLLQYEHEPPDQPETVGLGLSFPLPLWNHNRGGIAAARAAREAAEIRLRQLRAQIVAEIATARQQYDAARERFGRFQEDIVPRSQHIRDTVSFAYAKGGASLADLLAAQRNDNDVRLDAVQAAADAANATAALQAAHAALSRTPDT